ncbi:MAG: amidohydrolase family protein [Pseudomonadota bacterium]
MNRSPPGGPIDCHVHIIDPARHPFAKGQGYHPAPHETGTAEALAATLSRHGIAGALLVAASGYGTDNRSITASTGPLCPRAVVSVDASITDDALRALVAAGAVGVRLNAVNSGEEGVRAASPLLPRLAAHGLLVELQCPAGAIARLAPPILEHGLTLVVDHMGYPDVRQGVGAAAFKDVLALAKHPAVAVKLSGAFRLSNTAPPHEDVRPFAQRIVDAFGPDRLVWGSDWPFIGVPAHRRPTYADTLADLTRWVGAPPDRDTILCHTPRRLFRWPAEERARG